MSRTSENFGWSFGNRPFLAAAAVSALWHLFWFFSVTIVVSPSSRLEKPKPQLVSLGPVLDDTIFRSLVEGRIEATPAFYRPRLIEPAAAQMPTESAERRMPGDVVSVPYGAEQRRALAGWVAGNKASPDFEWPGLLESWGGAVRPPARFEGPAAGRQVLFAPPKPALPPGADPSARFAVTRARFSVDPSGAVISADILASGGYPEIDLLWLEYLRRIQFAPMGNFETGEKSEVSLSFEEVASSNV